MVKKMERPGMILFDYGETLIHEAAIDLLRGERAVFQYVAENPRHITPEEAAAFGGVIFERANASRVLGFEVHEWPMLRCKYEALGLKFSLPTEELEEVLWDGLEPGRPTEHIEELLGYLREQGIPTGVISNIGWSGRALERRLGRLLPGHRFEFVVASSEYVMRKPDPVIFAVALEKAGMEAGQVWFCGDNPVADVEGARASGLFPVLYRPEGPQGAECLPVRDWRELIGILDKQ